MLPNQPRQMLPQHPLARPPAKGQVMRLQSVPGPSQRPAPSNLPAHQRTNLTRPTLARPLPSNLPMPHSPKPRPLLQSNNESSTPQRPRMPVPGPSTPRPSQIRGNQNFRFSTPQPPRSSIPMR